MRETLETQEKGGRTWFGTLTLTPEWQREMQRRAFVNFMSEHASSEPPEWLNDMACDEQFKLVRQEILTEVQKFWKRLRKSGHSFKYFVVFERHKSGLPHMHFLLHEQDAPIRKRDIQSQWPFGFTNVSIVGGNSKNSAAPEKAAWYVVKYLSKSYQSRQLASRGYKPQPKGSRGNVSPVQRPPS